MNCLTTTVACFLGSLLLTTALRADEVRLKDGRVLYGKVIENPATDRGAARTWTIETRDGAVQVAVDDVVERTTDPKLRERLRELATSVGDSPFGNLQLAMRARDYGLAPELWRHLDRVIGDPAPRSAALQNRLDDFLGELEPDLLARKWRAADTVVRVRELVRRHRRDGGGGQRAALLELLRREPNADKDLRALARADSDPQRRLLAVEALALRGTSGNDAFTWRTAILDRDQAVRHGASALARRRGEADRATTYLAPGLMHSAAEIRVRTAEAYGELGTAEAMKLLVLAGPNAGKALAAADGGVRAHVAFLQQQAYIRDFDVEVAQASFIADPQIGILQSGTVLDVTVLGVTQEQVRIVRAYRAALNRLSGSDPGADPRRWPSWLQTAQPVLPTPATPAPAPTKAAPSAPQKSGSQIGSGRSGR